MSEQYDRIEAYVRSELSQALCKFPSMHSAHEGWAVIKEELDELWDEVRTKQSTPGRNTRMGKEATQIAAMAMRFLLDMPGFKN